MRFLIDANERVGVFSVNLFGVTFATFTSAMQSSRFFLGWNIRFYLLLPAVLASGMLLTYFSFSHARQSMYEDLTERASRVVQGVDVGYVLDLTGTEHDLILPAYLRLKAFLTVAGHEVVGQKQIYLLGRRPDQTLVVLVDGEPIESPDYSPPGAIYNGADKFEEAFSGQAHEVFPAPMAAHLIGSFSIYVPIREPRSGDVLALLGVKVSAAVWRQYLLFAAAEPVALTFVLLLLLLAEAYVHRRSRRDTAFTAFISWNSASLAVFFAGLILSAYAALCLHRMEQQRSSNAFARLADSELNLLQQSLFQLRDYGLPALAYFFEASENVTLAEFNHFTNLGRSVSHRSTWGWIPRVTEAERAHFEETIGSTASLPVPIWEMDADGHKIQAHIRSEYYPLRYVVPHENHHETVGFDLNSDPVRLAAINEVVRTRMPAATDPLRLVTDMPDTLSTLLFYPVFSKDEAKTVSGIVGASLSFEDLIENFDNSLTLEHSVYAVYSPTDMNPTLLATSGANAEHGHKVTEVTRILDLYGKVFLLRVCARSKANAYFPLFAGNAIFAIGVLLAVMLAVMIGLPKRQRRLLEQLVTKRTGELRVKTEELEQYFNSSLDLLCIADKKGRFLRLNPEWEKTLGYSISELQGRSLVEFVHPDDREATSSAIARLAAGEIVLNLENRYLHHDGSYHWLEWRSVPQNDQFFAVARDVTARKRAEAEWSRRDELLEAAAEAAQMLLVDRDISSSVPRALALVGNAADQDRAYIFENHFDKETGELLMSQRYEWVRSGISPQIDNPQLQNLAVVKVCPEWFQKLNSHKFVQAVVSDFSGRERQDLEAQGIVSILAVPIYVDDHFWGFIGLDNCSGVCNWTAGERAILSSLAAAIGAAIMHHQTVMILQQQATVIEQSPEAIVLTDSNSIIQYVNPAFEKISGYSRSEVLGKNPRVLKSGRQDDAFYTKLWQTISEGLVWTGQLVNKRKDGTFYTEESVISPVRNAAGGIVGYAAIKRNVTDDLLREEQLRMSLKMESIGRLTGGIAHDLNNLLMPILAYSEMLLEEMPKTDHNRESIQHIWDAGGRARDLVRQLLAFSRKQPLRVETLDFNQVLRGFESLLRRVVRVNITIDYQLSPEPLLIQADRGQIEQILMNLAVNAQDAISSSGVLTLSLKNVMLTAEQVSSFHASAAGRYAMLSVEDTGVGISPDIMDEIFDPFFTTKPVGEGTGLGLSTVFGIAQQHKGGIRVSSVLGQGTVFDLIIPCAAMLPEKVPIADVATFGEKMQREGTVWIIDDEPVVRKIARATLTLQGYRVFDFENPLQLLEFARGGEPLPDLLLTDVVMPEMSGVALVQQFKKISPSSRVVFMSGYSREMAELQTLPPDAAFLRKPFSVKDLLAVVSALLA